MKLSVLTLFPEIFEGYITSSIMAKAVERGLIQFNFVNIRDYAFDKHKTCDDAPYGGGAGMLMLAAPLARALEAAGASKKDGEEAAAGQAADGEPAADMGEESTGLAERARDRSGNPAAAVFRRRGVGADSPVLAQKSASMRIFELDALPCDKSAPKVFSTLPSVAGQNAPQLDTSSGKRARVVFVTPSGMPFNQNYAAELAREPELILLCGRYEGIDQRIVDLYVDDEISVGDYILSSGEVAALAVIDATYRLLDAVISPASLDQESFSGGLLEYPQWTRPEIYDNICVPEVLLSGHHENIRKWCLQKSVEKTCTRRPDLIERGIQNGIFDAETLDLIKLFHWSRSE